MSQEIEKIKQQHHKDKQEFLLERRIQLFKMLVQEIAFEKDKQNAKRTNRRIAPLPRPNIDLHAFRKEAQKLEEHLENKEKEIIIEIEEVD